jgi:hypothetical protein
MSRLKKLKEQHPELNISLIDILAKVDPTDTYKYTEFLIKMTKGMFIDDEASDIGLNIGIDILGSENVEYLYEFEKHSRAGRLKNSDISTYKNWEDISSSVSEADEILRLKELENEVKKLHEDSEWLVLIPLSFEASKMYGMGTKWCTTQEQHWNSYLKTHKLIYVINKVNNEKYGISKELSNEWNIQAFLSNDEEISPLLVPIPSEIMKIIIEEVKKEESTYDLCDKTDVNIIMKYPEVGTYLDYNTYSHHYSQSVNELLQQYIRAIR